MKRIIGFFILLYLGINLNAQTVSTVSGTILSDNNIPLEGVSILCKEANKATTTNAEGFFSIELAAGKYTLLLSGDSFGKKQVSIDLTPGESKEIRLKLSDKTVELKELTVTAHAQENTLAKAQQELQKIAGGTNIVSMNKLKAQRSLTLKDALEMQPGVIIQEFFGSNDQPRLNIRGSGIQGNPQFRGVDLLQDGIPIGFADGSFIIGLPEPQAANYIEVFRGANGLKYGGSTLGGAINLVSKTGYTAAPLDIKIEGGSFDYKALSLSSGFVSGKTDAFASLSYNKADGYREWNKSERWNASFNLGHKFSDKLQNRLYGTYTHLEFDVPGPLNWAQIQDDPKQINPGIDASVPTIGPNVVFDKPRRETDALRFADKIIYKINEKNSLETALFYQYADDVFYFPMSTGVRSSIHNDMGIRVTYSNYSDKNELHIGVSESFGLLQRKYAINLNGIKRNTFANNRFSSQNFMVYAEDIFKLSHKLSAVASAQFSYNIRNNRDEFTDKDNRPTYSLPTQQYSTFSSPDTSLDQDFTGFNPKIGIIYTPNSKQRIFANLSRSYEPPAFEQLFSVSGGSVVSSPTSVSAVKLDAQTATTAEIGSKGNAGRFYWDASIYRSWVKDEILTTTDVFGLSSSTTNSPYATIHQGLELGVKAILLKHIFSQKGDALTLSGVYNYSDYFFTEGSYKDNQIAGVPKNYITGELKYTHPIGIFISANTEWLPDNNPTDHQNTKFQPAYQLFGIRAGYNKNNWSLYVDCKNITDEKYAASYLITDGVSVPSPFTADDFTTFVPGTGASINIGISYKINNK